LGLKVGAPHIFPTTCMRVKCSYYFPPQGVYLYSALLFTRFHIMLMQKLGKKLGFMEILFSIITFYWLNILVIIFLPPL